MNNQDSPPWLRLFVAIEIPEPVRNEILRAQRELQQAAPPTAVRWTPPEQFHLTLKFLGDVPTGSVETLKPRLAEVCTGIQPFGLCAVGIGFFPNVRSPRVIWAGIECDEPGLKELQARVETSLAPFAEKPAAEKFLAHATLGRFQKFRRYRAKQLLPRAMALDERIFGEWQVEEICLFRSELSPHGARHSLLTSFPLMTK